jgi:hypothetical protein
MSKTMADWWDSLGQIERQDTLRSRGLKTDAATRPWSGLGWFIQGVLNDRWWWEHTGQSRPDVVDGPVDADENKKTEWQDRPLITGDFDYAQLELQAAAAAKMVTELSFVLALVHLLWLRLGATVAWLHDEMLVEMPSGRLPSPPSLYDFNRNGTVRELRIKEEK